MKSESRPRRRSWRGLLAMVAGVALVAGVAALFVVVLDDSSRRDAQVTEPQAIATCLDRGGAVFSEFGDDPEAVTLAVDLTGQTSNAPNLYLYVASTDDVGRRVLARLREIAESADIDVEDNGRVLLAYVSEPTSEHRAAVKACLGTQ